MEQASRAQRKQIKSSTLWITVLLLSVLAGAVVWAVTSQANKPVVNDFESCKKAGGAILESYPEQCLKDGKTYPNTSQVGTSNEYIGLSEQDALDKARASNVPARVVERDNEPLPVTLDYLLGRHNFHVRDSHVYKVDIEGSEQ